MIHKNSPLRYYLIIPDLIQEFQVEHFNGLSNRNKKFNPLNEEGKVQLILYTRSIRIE